MATKYETFEFRPLHDYEADFYRKYPATNYCSTPKCGQPITHVRMVTYQHYRYGREGRRDKRLNLCAECAARFQREAKLK